MSHFTAGEKHHILLEYAPQDHTRSFAALAERHSVAGGKEVVREWHQRWDGTKESLEHRAGAGRPRILSAEEVDEHGGRTKSLSRSTHRHGKQLMECTESGAMSQQCCWH